MAHEVRSLLRFSDFGAVRAEECAMERSLYSHSITPSTSPLCPKTFPNIMTVYYVEHL